MKELEFMLLFSIKKKTLNVRCKALALTYLQDGTLFKV